VRCISHPTTLTPLFGGMNRGTCGAGRESIPPNPPYSERDVYGRAA
jgi:hypothetical protein